MSATTQVPVLDSASTIDINDPEPLPVAAPRLWVFAIFLIFWSVIAYVFYPDEAGGFINWYTTVLWTIPVGISIIGIIGYFRSRPIIKAQPLASDDAAIGTVDTPFDVVIMTIGAERVFDALTRVIRSTRRFDSHFSNYRVRVVSEAYNPKNGNGAMNDRIAELVRAVGGELVIVPPPPEDGEEMVPGETYQTPNNTRFKARAAQYNLGELITEYGGVENIPDDHWTGHLDDDTSVKACTVRKWAAFIKANPHNRRGSKDVAQGILAYERNESSNLWMWLADAARTGDDVLRFPATTASGTPLAGLHGENLLTRTIRETEGRQWDFGPNEIVEDSRWALEFAQRHPGKTAWITARCFGSTPLSAMDFMEQRARWAEGMMALALNRLIPLKVRLLVMHNMFIWLSGLLQPVLVVAAISFMISDFNVAPITPWIAPLWVLSAAYTYWSYWEGLRQNARASGRKSARLSHKLLLLPGIAIFSVLEGAGGTWGSLRHLLGVKKKFSVVGKSSAEHTA